MNSWTWPGQEGKVADIEIYAPGTCVELIQNGVSLGKQPIENCRAFFKAEYRTGSLEAVCFDESENELARNVLSTAKDDEQLTVVAEDASIQAGGEDICFVNIAITDAAGTVKMLRDRKIRVQVEGGELLAVGSGNPESTERFDAGAYTSYHGRVTAIVAGYEAGKLRVTASAEGLPDASVEIEVL